MDSVADIVYEIFWRIPFHLPLELKGFLYQATRHISVGDILAPETLSWQGNSTGILSLKEAWNLLRSHAIEIPWSGLIWSKFVSPYLASMSWRLPQRKTSKESWEENNGTLPANWPTLFCPGFSVRVALFPLPLSL